MFLWRPNKLLLNLKSKLKNVHASLNICLEQNLFKTVQLFDPKHPPQADLHSLRGPGSRIPGTSLSNISQAHLGEITISFMKHIYYPDKVDYT